MATDEPSPSSFLTDSLSNITRAERRNLLIASTVGILVAKAGLIPTRFSTLGLEFEHPEQSGLVWMIVATIAYFIVAFTLYGLSDWFIWRKTYQDYLERSEVAASNYTIEDQYADDELRTAVPGIAWFYRWSKPLAWNRVVFDAGVPLLIALYAVFALLQRLWKL